MVVVDEMKKTYTGFSLECSMEVDKGRIIGIVGENGAGKSTLFKVLTGLTGYDEGKVRILGKEPKELKEKEKMHLGIVMAESGFSGYLKVNDVIPILSSMYSGFEKNKFVDLCAKLNLPFDKPIRNFSTGMKVKLKMISALTHNADLLLLDEPTTGLDVAARNEVLDMLRLYMEENENRSILITSHISSDLENLCDDIYVLNRGKIVLHEDMNTLSDNYGILKLNQKSFEEIDKDYIMAVKKESFGYTCLTNEKQFYLENYPDIVIEKGGIDRVMILLSGKESHERVIN